MQGLHGRASVVTDRSCAESEKVRHLQVEALRRKVADAQGLADVAEERVRLARLPVQKENPRKTFPDSS